MDERRRARGRWMLVLPVLIRSWTIAGYPLGPPRPPKVIPLPANVWDGIKVLTGHYASARYEEAQLLAAAVALLACLAWLVRTRRAGLAQASHLPRRYFRESQRLQWVARQTTPDDLLIADDAWDLGFDRPRKVVIFDYHNSPVHPLTGPGLRILLSWARSAEHENVYLILRDTVPERELWMKEPFLADLMSGRLESYPHLEHVGRLNDAYVYRWKCGPCAASGGYPPASAAAMARSSRSETPSSGAQRAR